MGISPPPARPAFVRRRGQDWGMEAASRLPAAAENEHPSIAELTPGRALAGRYACVRKDRLTARNGSTYLSLELRDRTGTLPARVFRDVDRIAAGFERGGPVGGRRPGPRFPRPPLPRVGDVRRPP